MRAACQGDGRFTSRENLGEIAIDGIQEKDLASLEGGQETIRTGAMFVLFKGKNTVCAGRDCCAKLSPRQDIGENMSCDDNLNGRIRRESRTL
jgi:hypothetical protein